MTSETNIPRENSSTQRATASLRHYRLIPIILGFILLFVFYIDGLSTNPPGFYVDESAIAYNAYCIAQTGANEFGTRFPLFFPVYTGAWTQYANPTQIYLLALPFAVIRPTVWLARVAAASWVFGACLLLGLLAKKITGKESIGLLVAVMAIFTPWLFDVSRLVMETFFYPMALALFLLAVFAAQKKESWSWLNILAIAATLMLLTYSYTIGRLLGAMLAAGLILFATSQTRLTGIIRTWVVYGLSLVPLLVYRSQHPGALTERFYRVSYLTPEMPWRMAASMFIKRYLEDLSLISLLLDGDRNPRHHLQGALGSFFIAVFIFAIMGLMIVIVRHWREAWWRFVIFGAAASIVPGSLTSDQFHSLRMVGYPIFLLLLAVPGLEFLLEQYSAGTSETQTKSRPLSLEARRVILAVLLIAASAEAIYFQSVYRREGDLRTRDFDFDYKRLYDAATALPFRPIYLRDVNSPAYVHAYWYASVEGRDRKQFVHLDEYQQPPAGAIVIASEPTCENCRVIMQGDDYVLYEAF